MMSAGLLFPGLVVNDKRSFNGTMLELKLQFMPVLIIYLMASTNLWRRKKFFPSAEPFYRT
jgi:hypothetical protein